MKTATKPAPKVMDPFDLDDRGFMVGYRFLGTIRRKSRRISKRTGKVVAKRVSIAKRLKKA